MKLTYKMMVRDQMDKDAIEKAARYFLAIGYKNWTDHVWGEGPAGFVVSWPNSPLYRVRVSDGWVSCEGA